MHMSVYLSHVCGWLRRQERTSDSADLEFQVVMSHPKCVHIVVPWKNSKHSTTEPFLQSLNFLMRPRFNKTLMITILYSRPKTKSCIDSLGATKKRVNKGGVHESNEHLPLANPHSEDSAARALNQHEEGKELSSHFSKALLKE